MSDWEPMKHPTVEIEGSKHTRPIEVRASCVTCGRCGQTVREDTARPQHPGLHSQSRPDVQMANAKRGGKRCEAA